MLNRSLSTRIVANFSLVAALTSSLAIAGYFASEWTRSATVSRDEAARTLSSASSLSAGAALVQRSATRFADTGTEKARTSAVDDLNALLDTVAAADPDADRMAAIETVKTAFNAAADAVTAQQAAKTALLDGANAIGNATAAVTDIGLRSGNDGFVRAVMTLTETSGRIATAAANYADTRGGLARERFLQEIARCTETVALIAKIPGQPARSTRLLQKISDSTASLEASLQAFDDAGDMSAARIEALNAAIAALDDSLAAAATDAESQLGTAQHAADNAANLMQIGLQLAAIGVPLAGLVLALLLGRAITRPIFALEGSMQAIAAGDLDATVKGGDRRDEIGRMARSVETFRLNELRRVELQAQAEHNADRDRRRHEAVGTLIDGFQAEAASLLGAMARETGRLSTAADRVLTIAEDGAGKARSAAEESARMSSNVQSLSSAAEELTASVHDISQQLVRSSDTVSSVSKVTDKAADEMTGLATAAGRIGEVVALIEAIAAQTNLLALNATIEAARAGEHGKGFAVVAGEVKNLAGQTAKATQGIAEHVSAIQVTTDRAVEAMTRITDSMREVQHYANSISSAVEQQAASTSEISRNTVAAAAGVGTVAADVKVVLDGAMGTRRALDDVNDVAQSVVEKTDALKARIDGFLSAVAAA